MLSLLGLIAANIVIATARHFKKPYQELIDQAVTMFRRSLEEYVHEIAKGEHEHDGMIYDGRPGSTN